MAMQKRLVQASLGKQSVLGTAATEGKFKFGLTEGAAVKVDADEQALDTTWSTRLVEGFERLSVTPGLEFSGVATRQLIGQLLFFMLGADAVTGSGAPYTHTITESEPLPIFTGFGRDNSDYLIVPDCRMDTLELSFEGVGALKYKATAMGTDVTASSTPWTTSGADERVQSGYFTMGGGSFTIDDASAVITKGTITLSNNLKPIQPAFQVTPEDYMPGQLSLEYSFTILPDDFGEWEKVIFGAAGLPASGIIPVPHYGAIVQEWLSGGTDTLTLTAPEVKTMVAFPAADPAGGPVELEITGETAVNLGGQAITWALVNSTPSY